MTRLKDSACQIVTWLESRVTPGDFMLLWLRLWVARIFFASGRTKTGGSLLEVSPSAIGLFDYEYGLPLLLPETWAQLSVYAETFLPLLLMLGLGARFAAVALLGMTIIIQTLVYPGHFAEHLTWAAALLAILALGPGRMSPDHLIRHRLHPK
ncbi:MAG: DoxX family membrane protein [Alphaproteobacteria bacterium]|nr:MAG: DoxX family membrane protein [Alphaproteobacteria bacterium]